jgi:hypothetical protein
MVICMKTTLNLDDELMVDVKRRAAETGRTMTEIIEEALREHLRRETDKAQPFDFRWVTVKGRALPGVDITDRDALYDLMEGRSGAERKVSEGASDSGRKSRGSPAQDKRR